MPADAAHVAEAPVVETARLRLRAHGNGCASEAVARMGAPRRLHPDLPAPEAVAGWANSS